MTPRESISTNAVLVPPPSTPTNITGLARPRMDDDALHDAADDATRIRIIGREPEAQGLREPEQLREHDVDESQLEIAEVGGARQVEHIARARSGAHRDDGPGA